MADNMKTTMTVKELSDELNISLATAYQLTKEPDFPTVKVGGRVLISTSGFKEWLSRKENKKK